MYQLGFPIKGCKSLTQKELTENEDPLGSWADKLHGSQSCQDACNGT